MKLSQLRTVLSKSSSLPVLPYLPDHATQSPSSFTRNPLSVALSSLNPTIHSSDLHFAPPLLPLPTFLQMKEGSHLGLTGAKEEIYSGLLDELWLRCLQGLTRFSFPGCEKVAGREKW